MSAIAFGMLACSLALAAIIVAVSNPFKDGWMTSRIEATFYGLMGLAFAFLIIGEFA